MLASGNVRATTAKRVNINGPIGAVAPWAFAKLPLGRRGLGSMNLVGQENQLKFWEMNPLGLGNQQGSQYTLVRLVGQTVSKSPYLREEVGGGSGVPFNPLVC